MPQKHDIGVQKRRRREAEQARQEALKPQKRTRRTEEEDA